MLVIRKLGSHDLEEFIRIRFEGLLLNPESFGRTYAEQILRPKSDFVEFLAPSRRRILWGAFRGEKLVGLVRLEAEGRGVRRYIYSMYVTPEERGRGLARRLLKIAITRAKRAREVRQILLTVETTNAVAVGLYRSEGFRECGLEKDTICVEGKFYSEFVMRKFVRSRRS
jgi:ribosomal protein S18 acetylase RimI-like enzyme